MVMYFPQTNYNLNRSAVFKFNNIAEANQIILLAIRSIINVEATYFDLESDIDRYKIDKMGDTRNKSHDLAIDYAKTAKQGNIYVSIGVCDQDGKIDLTAYAICDYISSNHSFKG